MARQLDVQYVRYYTDGSAARKLELYSPVRTTKPAVRRKKQKRRVVYIDPISVLGLCVAVIMLITMAVGMVRLDKAQQEREVLENYVARLQEENEDLQQAYHAGYDLEEVENMALALGMVPKAQVKHVQLDVSDPAPAAQPDFWQQLYTFLTDLFA